MAEAFIQLISRKYGRPPRRIAAEARETLLRHDWPGNVRELKNLMERAVILARGAEITTRDLGPLAVRHLAEPDPFSFPEFPSLREAREWFEGAYIQRELKHQNGNMTRVAERLGLDRSNLYKRLKVLGIEAERNLMERLWLKIGETASQAGVKPKELRYWEEVIPEIQPRRSKGNLRYYHVDELDRLVKIRDWLEEGLTVADCRELLLTGQLARGWTWAWA